MTKKWLILITLIKEYINQIRKLVFLINFLQKSLQSGNK